MNPNCIAAVAGVFGREPTPSEVSNIEARIASNMRREAVRDPAAWAALPTADRIRTGAAKAAEELAFEKARKLDRANKQVIALARTRLALSQQPGTPMEALARVIAFHADAKGSVMSVETRARAVERDALRQMVGTLESTVPKFFGLIEQTEGIRDIVRELHGQKSNNPDAAKSAKAFTDVAEQLRQRFNRAGGDVGKLENWGLPHHHIAGGDVGKLENWGLPHHHSQTRVASAGKDRWVTDVLPILDRSKYLDEYGRPLPEPGLRRFLEESWTTIATGGANKIEPGQFTGSGMRANRGNQSRQIHFRTGDDWLNYQQNYGEAPAYDVMIGHIGSIAKDIALVEALGPNPDQAYRVLRDEALKAQTLADPVSAGKLQEKAHSLDNLYGLVAGKSIPVANARVAMFFDFLRNLMVSAKLGSATLSSITDEGTMRVAARVNNLPQVQLARNELAALNPANPIEKRMALRAGLAMNTLAASMNRFANESMVAGWSAKAAQATLRASGLNALTDARRRAWGVTQMGAIGGVVKDHATLADIDPIDHRILKSKGITPTDYAVWKLAQPEDWGGGNDTMLTPDAIYRIPDAQLAAMDMGSPQQLKENAATRLLGLVLEETDIAVIEPGARERAMMMAHLQRGSLKGELARSFFLFKSFPLAMITRHWSRALSAPTTGGKAAYLAALTASTTLLGMLALQASQVVQGKDPRSMADGRTWMQALLKGGALSLFGDFLLADQTEGGQSLLATAAGPVAGLAEDVMALTVGNLHQAARGEDTHVGAEAVKLAKNNFPGANLWYTRAAIDHLLLHQLQEYLSPGYLRKMRRRSEKEYNQRYWWEPGEMAPERAPDLEAAVEER